MAKLMLVDDERDLVAALQKILVSIGHDVRVATSAHDALEILQPDKLPDLLIVDILMPGMNGLELVRNIREMDGANKLPILIVSASTHLDVDSNEPYSQVSDFLQKPFQIEDFLEAVNQLLNPS